MDPISILSAVASNPTAGAGMIQQPGAAPFRLPEMPQGGGVASADAGAFPATQVYPTANVSEIGASSNASSLSSGLSDMINQVNQYGSVAGAKVRDVLLGGPTTVNDAMVAEQEASVSFKLLSTVRDKVVDAYQQIMNMQI